MAGSRNHDWSGEDVTVAEIERELAQLRGASVEDDGSTLQRTSVMTHVAWAPPHWVDAAERTLEGLAARHPSRTLILVPRPDEPDGLDAELSVRCFPAGDREICGEVIELHLRGDRARAPASIVVPLAIADLPLFLRWRGEPPFAAEHFRQLVALADRVIVDSTEWERLAYAELAEQFRQAAFSDIAWARLHPWRVALAGCWPELDPAELAIAGPAAESTLLHAWLESRLGRQFPPPSAAATLELTLAGSPLAAADEDARSPSDLLSAELDRSGRDRVYEDAVVHAVRGARPLAAPA